MLVTVSCLRGQCKLSHFLWLTHIFLGGLLGSLSVLVSLYATYTRLPIYQLKTLFYKKGVCWGYVSRGENKANSSGIFMSVEFTTHLSYKLSLGGRKGFWRIFSVFSPTLTLLNLFLYSQGCTFSGFIGLLLTNIIGCEPSMVSVYLVKGLL